MAAEAGRGVASGAMRRRMDWKSREKRRTTRGIGEGEPSRDQVSSKSRLVRT